MRLIFSILFALSLITSLHSQAFLTELSQGQFSLSQEDSLRMDLITNTAHVLTVKPVSIGSLDGAISNNTFSCYLPILDTIVTFDITQLEVKDPNNYLMIGDGDPCNQVGGLAMIHSHESFLTSFLIVNDREFEIQTLNDQVSLLLEIDRTSLPLGCGIIDSLASSFQENPNSAIETRSPIDNVKLLVLSNQSAQDYTDIPKRIIFELERTNTILDNSGVTDIEIQYVYDEFTSYIPTGFGDTDADNLAINQDLIDLREYHEADIVVVLVAEDLVGSNNGIEAFGWISNNCQFGNSETAYVAIVDVKANSCRYTFSHEVYHIFGARHHNLDQCGPTYAGGHQWAGGAWNLFTKHTVMRAGSNNYNRVPHISNPNISFKEDPTGIEDISENYLQVLDLKEDVSLYRDGLAEDYFEVEITGPYSGENGLNYNLTAHVGGCTNPEYKWYKVIGANGQTGLLLSETAQLQIQMSGNSHFTVKVVATCEDSEAVDFHRVSNIDYDPCSQNEGLASTPNIKVHPSPAHNNISVIIDENFDSMSLIDIHGNQISNFEITGKLSFDVDVTELNSGMYLLSLYSIEKNMRINKKILVVK